MRKNEKSKAREKGIGKVLLRRWQKDKRKPHRDIEIND